uniref:Uncharacterized protein n=1 Tax=Tetranychus urticae TaxID=32264 RepID=T1KZJ7_TETUR
MNQMHLWIDLDEQTRMAKLKWVDSSLNWVNIWIDMEPEKSHKKR